jgi:hypothetical protein
LAPPLGAAQRRRLATVRRNIKCHIVNLCSTPGPSAVGRIIQSRLHEKVITSEDYGRLDNFNE